MKPQRRRAIPSARSAVRASDIHRVDPSLTIRVSPVAVALLGLLLFPACVWAQAERPAIEVILRRALTAAHSTNVRGREHAFVQPPHLPMVHIVRQVVQTRDGWRMLRWEQPDMLRGTIIVDDGQWTHNYEPSQREIASMRSTPRPRDLQGIARQTRLILRNYQVHLDSNEPLAGRTCYVLTLKPYAAVSHTLKLWVDTKTYYILGQQENSAKGHTIALTLFTWVEYPRVIRAAEVRNPFPRTVRKRTNCPSQIFAGIGQLRRAAGFEVCSPYSMPGGYELERCELITTRGGPMTCLRFTDGMFNISVYQCPARQARPSNYHARQALLYQLGDCVVNYESGPMNFMLIGRLELAGLLAVTHVLNVERERTFLSGIASIFRVEPAALEAMRDQGIGLDTIVALHEIRAQAHCSMSTLVEQYREGYDWRGIARRCKADVRRFIERVHYYEAR